MATRFSRKLPDGFQASNLGTCIYAVYLLTEHNVRRGFTDFNVVKGHLVFTDFLERPHREFHCWIMLKSGAIYDPTYEQLFRYPIEEQPCSSVEYSWRNWDVYTPEEIIEEGCNITPEFKAYHYKQTMPGEFFKGPMWQSEIDHPDLIPEKFRV